MSSSDHDENNFDFLRHLAAFLVIYGHSLALLGLPYQRLWGTPVSVLGVLMFFSLSGYLVTQSWQRDPRLVAFFIKRALRIFPALTACVIFTACLLGPIFTRISVCEYIWNPHFAEYFENLILLIRYNLPGVFESNIYPNAMNGSLWTLPVEFLCYIVVSALAFGRRPLRFTTVALAGIVICTCSAWLAAYTGPQIVLWGTDVPQAASLMPFFFVGSFFFVAKGLVPLRLDVAIVAIFALFAVEGLGLGNLLTFSSWLAVPYIVITFGLAATAVLRRFGRFGDFSYGMYLYAFPIQQSIVHLFKNDVGFYTLVVLTTAGSAACACLSWHLVEKRALMMKPASLTHRTSAKNMQSDTGLDRMIAFPEGGPSSDMQRYEG